MTNPASSDLAVLVGRLNAFQRSLPLPLEGVAAVARKTEPPAREAEIIRRLEKLEPELATSFRQVLDDLEDSGRATYVGPVGEAREVLRAAVHMLAPDDAVKAKAWFKGDDQGRPTQAECARYAAEMRIGKDADATAEAADAFEEKLGKLFRTIHTTASKKFHAGTQRKEVRRIVGYVVVVLDDILPD